FDDHPVWLVGRAGGGGVVAGDPAGAEGKAEVRQDGRVEDSLAVGAAGGQPCGIEPGDGIAVFADDFETVVDARAAEDPGDEWARLDAVERRLDDRLDVLREAAELIGPVRNGFGVPP